MKSEQGNKILIIVPHQDDEINIAGGYIARGIKENKEIYILYTTNGDYIYDAKERIKECYKSCRRLGVKNENIFFLGYSDQYSRYDTHLFNSNEKWTSRNGKSMTYAPYEIEEIAYRYTKEHHIYNRKNFISDIKLFISKLKPETIISIDYDSHCDHRATSLGVEKAIGEFMKEEPKFRPIVYKGFAYPTAYFGKKDYNLANIKSTRFVTEQHSFCKMENPYYVFEDRIRFALTKQCIKKPLFKNKIFKALKAHKSQIIIKEAFSIINGDQVYWQRRTDNLLYDAKIKVSSGDKDKLSDFLLFDSRDVLKGNTQRPIFEDCAWAPDDENPRIDIELAQAKLLDEIKLYHSVNYKKKLSFKILLEGKEYGKFTFDNEMINTVKISHSEPVKDISIIFDKKTSSAISLSELEIFEKKEEKIDYILGLDNDDVIYKNTINDSFKLKIYGHNTRGARIIMPEECDFYVNGKQIEYGGITFAKLPNKVKLLISLKDDSNVKYECVLVKEKCWHRIKNSITNLVNKTYLRLMIILFKTYRKLFIKKQKNIN